MKESRVSENHMSEHPENIVFCEESRPCTTSLIVAEVFEKKHRNVLKAIENLECSPEFSQLNFELAEYKDAQGKMRPAYRITRDGFAFLVMGFTGKAAAVWKEKFLAAFNAMEKSLMRPARKFALPEPEDEAMCQVRRTNILRGLVSLWAFVDHIPVPVAELSVCKHVGVSRLEDIDQERHATAAHYLFSVSHTPVNSSGEKATEEQKTILKNITHACTQTKVFRDYDFSTIYERFSFTRGFVECKFNFEDISSHDANKIIICSWGIMSQLLRLDVEKV